MDTPLSRTTSGAARPPASDASHPACSPSTPPGSNSASRLSTFWPGPASCCWTASWLPPNPRNSATGFCTSLPVSPAADAASICGWQQPGLGDTNSPPPSTVWPPYPAPPADQPALATYDTKDLGEPDQRAGSPPCPPPDTASIDPTAAPRHPKRNSEANPHASAAISFPGFEQSSCGRSCLRASGCPALGSVFLCLADLITDHRLAGADNNRTQILEPHGSASSSPTAGGRTGGHRPP